MTTMSALPLFYVHVVLWQANIVYIKSMQKEVLCVTFCTLQVQLESHNQFGERYEMRQVSLNETLCFHICF